MSGGGTAGVGGDLPRVQVVATGGTIAGAGAGGSYRAGRIAVTELLAAAPRLRGLARLQAEQFCNLGSQDLGAAQWLGLARRLGELARDPALAGVVVTHGTDTMEETAFFLDLVLPGGPPVVLTGAMRPATDAQADGPENLADAVAVAADPAARGRGVLVVMAGGIHAARAVRKRHTSAPDALGSVGAAPLGACGAAGVRFAASAPSGPRTPACALPGALPRVDIVCAHADLGRDLIDHAVACGARGLVLAGVGAGNAPAAALAGMADAARAGVAVVRSSRVGAGAVAPQVEIDDAALGFIAAGDLGPPQARVLLMLALAAGEDVAAIRGRFAVA